jgi:uncharacterized protein (TIGR03000 family)
MRKAILIIVLSAMTVAATANDVFAQRWGNYRGWGSRGVGYGNYYGNYYYGNNYYGRNYYGGYYTPSYYGIPYTYGRQYYYANPIVSIPVTTEVRSYYEPLTAPQTAMVVVLVPQPDALVWFNGAATMQQGMERTFSTPPLDPSVSNTYTVRARWMENGQSVERDRVINVQPGQSVTVRFP